MLSGSNEPRLSGQDRTACIYYSASVSGRRRASHRIVFCVIIFPIIFVHMQEFLGWSILWGLTLRRSYNVFGPTGAETVPNASAISRTAKNNAALNNHTSDNFKGNQSQVSKFTSGPRNNRSCPRLAVTAYVKISDQDTGER